MAREVPGPRFSTWPIFLYLVVSVAALSGIVLTIGGAYLVWLDGSAYYLVAGLVLITVSVLIGRRRVSGPGLYGLLYIGTAVWAYWEVGLTYWPLVPRLGAPTFLLVLCLLVAPLLRSPGQRLLKLARAAGIVFAVLFGLSAGAAFYDHGVLGGSGRTAGDAPRALIDRAALAEWTAFGGGADGRRYSRASEITSGNVGQLAQVWQYRTGDIALKGSDFENTPLVVNDRVFLCTPHNVVHAVDLETGRRLWTFDPKVKAALGWNKCRGVGYHARQGVTEHTCAERVVLTTLDARLFALDAMTGKACPGFGTGGFVDLKTGIGATPILYQLTSAPLVAGDTVIIGGMVADNQMPDEPSGVIRAYDILSGRLVWAWDLANPTWQRQPPPGQYFTPATPNSWGTQSFDPALGLVFVPLGNGTPDHWGAQRSRSNELYTDAVVALDIHTGRERWRYQTVHHDLWDYDLAAQPVLQDIPDGHGGIVPALIQPTKTGQLFVLDRRTGKPLRKVEERPVPQGGGLPGDWLAKTQPFATGMAAENMVRLREADMWGATPFDQLACRIQFRKLRYEGAFTPLSTTGTLVYPSTYGGYNWGGAAVSPDHNYVIVNDIRLPMVLKAVARKDVQPQKSFVGEEDGMLYPQNGTPFAMATERMKSPLGIPCNAPPYGTLSAVDLKTGSLVWRRPLGTLEDTVLHGVRLRAPIPIGMPTMGGPTVTAGNLVFYAGTVDSRIRAFDVRDGRLLWSARLPVGNQGGVVSATSRRSGRQYIVLTAGGARESPERGDYLIAFALPHPVPDQ